MGRCACSQTGNHFFSRPLCPLTFLYVHAYLLWQQLTVRQLLPWTRDTLLQDRPELFMKGDTV